MSLQSRGTRPSGPVLETRRLKLRRWRGDDREPFAELNGNGEVMEHFPTTLTRKQSDELIEAIEAGFEVRGFGLWALELRESGEFIGFTGLAVRAFPWATLSVATSSIDSVPADFVLVTPIATEKTKSANTGGLSSGAKVCG